MARRHRVTFKAHIEVTRPVKVSFTTRAGGRVAFKASKAITKPVKVSFLTKAKKK